MGSFSALSGMEIAVFETILDAKMHILDTCIYVFL